MFEEIALAIKEYCPEAWVINYTNPMTVCTRTLYATFPEIKAFGCCHEVFGTQKLLVRALQDICGMPYMPREEIKVNVLGVNHFTWFDKAQFRDIDLFKVYEKFCDKYAESGYTEPVDTNWQNKMFPSHERVKMDLSSASVLLPQQATDTLQSSAPASGILKIPKRLKSGSISSLPFPSVSRTSTSALQEASVCFPVRKHSLSSLPARKALSRCVRFSVCATLLPT